MGKIAFVFSGQGDQYPGMGKTLFEEHPAAREVFALCDRLRPDTSRQCFEGSDEELKDTANTQPCLFAVELAAAAVLRDAGIRPDAVAGFSLGEVAALTAAGAVDTEAGFRLVCTRGELMSRAASLYDTSMAAVVKLTTEQVETICSHYSEVYPVNYNCPGQITVSGLSAQMPAFFAEVKEAGGRALPLKVTGAFHSPFMNDAAALFAKELTAVTFKAPDVTLYSNVTGKPYTEHMKELLANQICHPVRWEAIIRHMIADGVDTFIEIGPGKTLTNMIGKIDPQVKRYCTAELSTLLEEWNVC